MSSFSIILDSLDNGEKVRRAAWPKGARMVFRDSPAGGDFVRQIYSGATEIYTLSAADIFAFDWEVV